MTASFAAALAVVAVLAVLMVAAMVRFSRAAIGWSGDGGAREPGWPRRLSPLGRWGAVYALAWLALIGAFLYLLAAAGEGFTARNLALLGVVVGGYLAVNALLILFARALIRANRRAAVDQGGGQGRGDEPAAGIESPAGGGEAGADEPAVGRAPEIEPASRPSPWSRARLALRTVAFLAGVLLLILVAEALPTLVRLGAWIDARRAPLLLGTGLLAGAGFLLFMGAIVHLVLTGGTPMSRTEETFTFSEVKTAWRARAWRVSPTWRRRFTLLVGAGLLTLGLMGVAVALSPTGLKLVVAAFVLSAAIRTVLALRRA